MIKALKTWSHVREWQRMNLYIIMRWLKRQLNLEEAISLQKQQHLSSTETPKRFLKIMDEKLSVVMEKELNDIKEKCVPNEEKLDGIDKEIRKYCNERD